MSSTLNGQSSTWEASTFAVENPPETLFGRVLPWALFAVLWVDLIRRLSFEWSSNEQYSYGWFVPIFALGLLWRRYASRPAPRPAGAPRWLTALVTMLVVALLPLRLLQEANPDWPLCNWLLTLSVVGISLYAVFLTGGLPWTKHFVFPVCFILVAVRWPYRIEHGFTQGLMHVVAGLTTHVLSWLDVMAFPRGNLIELSTGVVGINEACSGIRSFQSTLMGALFLGELYRLRWPWRLLLVGSGVVLAFGFNVLRTFGLTWQASSEGIGAVEKWHDTAGLTIFLLCFICLWLFAGRFSKGTGRRQAIDQKNAQLQTLFPKRLLIVVGCLAICVLTLTEIWYRWHERTESHAQLWSATLPVSNPNFQNIELLPGMVKTLQFDRGRMGKWREDDGSDWTLYFFRWNPMSIQSVIRARGHRPDVCLPAVGFRQMSQSGLEYFEAGSLKLPFQKYTYQADGRSLYVFFCLWQDGDEEQKGIRTLTEADRLQWALSGRRRLGQQTLEIIVTGYDSLERADQEVRKRLPQLIRIEEAGRLVPGKS